VFTEEYLQRVAQHTGLARRASVYTLHSDR